jgi:hypothetical protein
MVVGLPALKKRPRALRGAFFECCLSGGSTLRSNCSSLLGTKCQPKESSTIVQKPSLTFLPWVIIGALGVLYLGKHTAGPAEQGKVDQAMPLVVEALRDTKFLHSAEMQMQETFEYSTNKAPADWAAGIPGVTQMVEKTTANHVWVAAHGTIGAGIDLSKADVRRSPTGITVTIPAAQLEPAAVHLKLVSSQRGAFWDDRSIALKAQDVAAERFQVAANARGLKDKAMSSAKLTLQKLFVGVTSVPVEVRVRV